MTNPADRPMSNADYRALAQFRHALRTFLKFSEDAARAEKLTPAQHQLLLAIRGRPTAEPRSVSDLATVLARQRHSTVELVNRAEAAGLVTSHADPHDARRRLVELTPDGDAVLARLSSKHRQELRTFSREMAEVLRELD